eukprot:329085_1
MGNQNSKPNETKQNEDSDFCDKDAIVNDCDGRRRLTESEDKHENIMECIGYLDVSFEYNGDKLHLFGTGTVFHTKSNGDNLVLTCSHNVRQLIHKCSKCNQNVWHIKQDQHKCNISNFNSSQMVKANVIKFKRRSILNKYLKNTQDNKTEIVEFGDTEQVYTCDINNIFIDEHNYSQFPTPSSGYDICVIQFTDKTKYYQKYVASIRLRSGQTTIERLKEFNIWGFPGDKLNYKGQQEGLYGMKSAEDGDWTFVKNQTTNEIYLKQKTVDVFTGQSGSSLWVKDTEAKSDENDVILCGVHSGGNDIYKWNAASLFNNEYLCKLKNYYNLSIPVLETYESKSDEKKMDFEMDIAMESRLKSNYNALDKLVVGQLQCEICQTQHNSNDLYICEHRECDNDGRIMCQECGDFCHRRKTHQFKSGAKHRKCVYELVKPERRYQYVKPDTVPNSETDVNVDTHVISMRSLVVSSSILTLGFAEQPIIWRNWYLCRITAREAVKQSTVALVSGGVTAASFAAWMGMGAAVGLSGGPVGIVIGGIVAAILFGVVTRYGLNKIMSKHASKKGNKMRMELQKEALLYYFGDGEYDIDDENKFNVQILHKKYRKLALMHHPDKNGGENTEWLRLSSYYGILKGIVEQKYCENSEYKNNSDDLSDEQRTELVKTLIKENARLLREMS